MSKATDYDKMTPIEHMLSRPDTYIGSIKPTTQIMDVFDIEEKIIKSKIIKYTPGFLKIFDEALVNARDASVSDKTCNIINIWYNKEAGYIRIFNNGDKAVPPIEEHPKHKSLIPSMIFGELLTSSNYDDTKKYDLVIASGLIEYFEDEDFVIDKLKYFIKDKGLIIINVTNIMGYSTCLNNITYHMKSNFIIKSLKEKIYKRKYGILNFKPKKHFIPTFESKLLSKKLYILSKNYIGFSLLPAPFNFIFSKILYKIDIYLQKLKFTPIKYLAASCVFCVRKN